MEEPLIAYSYLVLLLGGILMVGGGNLCSMYGHRWIWCLCLTISGLALVIFSFILNDRGF